MDERMKERILIDIANLHIDIARDEENMEEKNGDYRIG